MFCKKDYDGGQIVTKICSCPNVNTFKATFFGISAVGLRSSPVVGFLKKEKENLFKSYTPCSIMHDSNSNSFSSFGAKEIIFLVVGPCQRKFDDFSLVSLCIL